MAIPKNKPRSLTTTTVKLHLPKKIGLVLFDKSQPWRYRILYGGRGAGKDWSVAATMIEFALANKIRVLWTREIQRSIKDSCHRLIADTIKRQGYDKEFEVLDTEIRCKATGSLFIFRGLRHNIEEIKSMEGVDYAICNEAQTMTKESFNILDPTIRKENSEIWLMFNTKYEDDFAYEFATVKKPDNAIVAKVNYSDNIWCPDVLKEQAARDKASDPILYKNKWQGDCVGMGGKVWPVYIDQPWDLGGHLREFPWIEVRRKANCFCAMDPHSKYFPFVVWGAFFPTDSNATDYTCWIYNEWPTYEMFGAYYSEIRHERYISEWGSLLDFSKEIMRYDETVSNGVRIEKRFLDTRFEVGAGSDNWATDTLGMVNELAKPSNGGLKFLSPPTKFIDIQREVLLSAMRYNTLMERSPFNQPHFFVAPHCKNVRQSLLLHRMEEMSERESERYKDPSDALRILYAGMKTHRFVPPVEAPQVPSDHIVMDCTQGSDTGWMA